MIIQGGIVLCACGENAARYMNERGELCCAICPLKENIDSIRLSDVPALLAWAHDHVARLDPNLQDSSRLHNVEIALPILRAIIGKGPERVTGGTPLRLARRS